MFRLSLRTLSSILTCCLLLGVTACGTAPASSSGAGADGSDPCEAAAKLLDAMCSSAAGLPSLECVGSDSEDADLLFSYFSDLNYEKVDGYALAYASDGKLADELSVTLLKSAEDAEEAKASVQRHLDSRKALYRNYAPAQVERVENAELFIYKNYVVLIICDEHTAAHNAFSALVAG